MSAQAAGETTGGARRAPWWLTGMMYLGLTVVAVGLVAAGNPRAAAREARRQVAVVGIGAGQKATVETLRWEVPREELMAAVKTATTRAGAVVSGTLSLMNQRTPDNSAEGPGPSWAVGVGVGNIYPFLSRIWWDNDSSEWHYYIPYWSGAPFESGIADPGCAEGEIAFVYGLADSAEQGLGTWPSAVVVKLGAGTNDISVNFSIATNSEVLTRERTHTPATGRDGSPVYSHETTAADVWAAVDPPWDYAVTLGSISWSGTQTWQEEADPENPYYPGYWKPNLSALGGGITFDFCQNGGVADTDYASIALQVGGIDLNFDHRHKTYGVFDLQGSGDTVTCHCETTGAGPSPASSWHIGYEWPLMIDFSGFHVKDRQSADVDGVRIAGPFQASPRVPASMTWSTTP